MVPGPQELAWDYLGLFEGLAVLLVSHQFNTSWCQSYLETKGPCLDLGFVLGNYETLDKELLTKDSSFQSWQHDRAGKLVDSLVIPDTPPSIAKENITLKMVADHLQISQPGLALLFDIPTPR